MGKLKLKHRILILAGIFLIAIIAFFIYRQQASVVRNEVYSATLEEAKLPVVYAEMCGTQMNCMRAHTSDVAYDETYDTLTILPEDRFLKLHVQGGSVYMISASYEIRNSDLTQLIEKTDITDIVKDGSDIQLTLPIQNLILKDKEYRLDLSLITQEMGEVHYYSRILLTDETELASEMLELVNEFSTRNFNYDDAKENTTYVETDGTADDTTLAYTNLKSTFNNLAYNGLKLTPDSKKDIRFCTYDGNTGEVHLSFLASRNLSSGVSELYEINETYTMRMGLVRLYLLNYSRKIREVYTGDNQSSGKRIILGINNENELDYLNTRDNNKTYFVATRDLWCFDAVNKSVKNIFSFRSNKSDDMVNGYQRHGIKLIRCDEEGNLTFLLYGYMNRGVHEGQTGMSLLTYDVKEDTVSEKFFLPIARTYESIKADVDAFSYLSNSNIYYAKIDGNFYAIDISEGSYFTLVEGLLDGNYSICQDKGRLAWQEENDKFGSSVINIFDLETGKKQEIRASEGMLLKVKGFIGTDIVISSHMKENEWKVNGIARSIPASIVEIMDKDLNVLKHYEHRDEYIGTIDVHDGRVNLQLLTKNADGSYKKSGEDTIVSSTVSLDQRDGIGSYSDDYKKTVYYVVVNEDVRRNSIKVAADTELVEGGVLVEDMEIGPDERYHAYGDNEMIVVTDEVAKAINNAYDKMGYVRCKGTTVYNRPAMVTSRILDGVETITKDLLRQRKDGELFDLYGITLREALYYVSMKYPVLAYTDSGRAVAIYAYDKSTVSLYDLNTLKREYWNQEEAGNMFARGGGDFSCDFTFD